MYLLCGLGQVTLEGTPDDWRQIHDRVRALSEFGLHWWTNELLPVIDQFIAAAQGKPDLDFWARVYKKHRYGSGSQGKISGWINTFYPYINGSGGTTAMLRNVDAVAWEFDYNKGTDEQDFPFGLLAAPVKVIDHGIPYDTKFYGGLVGVTMDPHTFQVKAESGWCVQNLGRTNE